MANKWGEYCPSCLWRNQHEDGNPCNLCVYTDTDPSKYIRMDETKRCGYWCENCRYNSLSLVQYPCNRCEWDMVSNAQPSEWAEKDIKPKPTKLPGAKDSKGKLKLSEVPPEIIKAIAVIREYGNNKYADPDNWRHLSVTVFHEALLRHALAIWQDAYALDPESGLPALWHLACNAAFMCALMEEDLLNGHGGSAETV